MNSTTHNITSALAFAPRERVRERQRDLIPRISEDSFVLLLWLKLHIARCRWMYQFLWQYGILFRPNISLMVFLHRSCLMVVARKVRSENKKPNKQTNEDTRMWDYFIFTVSRCQNMDVNNLQSRSCLCDIEFTLVSFSFCVQNW